MPKRKAQVSKTTKKQKVKEEDEVEEEKIVSPRANRRQKEKNVENDAGDEGMFDLKWENVEWEETGDNPPMFCLYDPEGSRREKVVGFDLDFTIVKPKSGAKFAKGASDWTWLYENVPTKLKQLYDDGYCICIFSNQGGIEKHKVTVKEIMSKTESIVKSLKFPIYAFYSTGENHYRKPSTFMWNYFVEKCLQNHPVDIDACYYVGDAAGRAKNWAPGKPKDFSCTDRMFAKNVGIEFKTPEEFFLNEKPAPFEWGSFDAVKFMANKKSTADGLQQNYHSKNQELIILVGMPASGKSTFFEQQFSQHGYIHINRDTLSTQAKCLQLVKDSINTGKSVVVDNTNPSIAGRADYIKLAKDKKIPSRCIILDTPKEIAHHLNYLRQTRTKGVVRRVPDVGYNVYNKNYQAPTLDEGFSEISNVQFSPHFDDELHETLFKQWTA